MSRIIGSRRVSGLRAVLISGLFGCAVQACDTGAPPEGTGAPVSAAGAEDVTTVRRAATGVVCPADPMAPCITTDNGRVLHNLKIVNMFMSAHWDDENPPTFSKAAINAFTQNFVKAANANRYFASARTDYENAGGTVSFGGDFDATGLERGTCFTPSFNGFTDFFSIDFWIGCLAMPGPSPVTIDDIGLRSTFGNIAAPDDSTIYVIYVPKGTNIGDKVPVAGVGDEGFFSCASGPNANGTLDAYHFWQETAKWEFEFLDCHLCADDSCKPFCCLGGCTLGTPFTVPQSFAYAVIPVECAANDPSKSPQEQFDLLTQNVTHEIVEAAVDPIVPTGWLDRGKQEFFPLFNPLSALKEGEIADICEGGGHGPKNVALDGTSVSTYWSTSAGTCVPRPLVNAKCQDVTVSTAPGTCSAPASVNNGSSDPGGGVLTITQSPPSPYGLGTTTVTLTATSSTSDSATCTGHVTVEDHTPPTFTSVPGPVTAVEGTTPNIGTATATDLCPGTVTITNNAPATFPIGVTTVTWTARDAAGNTSTATQTVRITCAGGPSSCANGHGCQTNDDCGSRVCTNLVCAPPACAPRCNRGALCGANADCGSQVCVANSCRAPACSPRCLQGAICGDNGDCSSFVCSSTNRCLPSSCSPRCNQGAPCGANGDCLAQRCVNGQCAPPTCSPACGTGALCNNNGDCRSHVCNGNRCT